jgi:predicted lipoprotein with Yx(FWY)xxD motif
MKITTKIRSQARPALRRGAVRSATAIGAVALVGLVAAACGSSTPSASAGTTTTGVTPAGTTATTGAPSTGPVVAKAVSTAKFDRPILVSSTGMTLYRFSADTSTSSACTASCTAVWPPVTVPSGTNPTGGLGTSGTFGTISRSDGTLQVTYDGHPLYTFSGDTTAGETNGQNITSDGGTWTVVTVGTASATTKTTTAPTPTTAPSSGGGYGY